MSQSFSCITFDRSIVGMLAAGVALAAAQTGCAAEPPLEEVGRDSARLDQADCAEYSGTWSQGKCTLPGGNTSVDVPIPPDPEPWPTWPTDDDPEPSELPQQPQDPGGGGLPSEGPSPDDHDRQFGRALNLARCLLQDPVCNAAASGPAGDGAQLLAWLSANGRIRQENNGAGPTPPPGGLPALASCSGTGTDATIRIYDAFYGSSYERTSGANQSFTVIHELAHATGHSHPEWEASAFNSRLWNACYTPATHERCDYNR